MIVPKVWIQKKLCLWFIGFARNSIHLYCTCKKRERKEERQKLTEFSWSNVPSGKRKNSCYLLLVVNGQSGRMPSSDHIVPPTSLPETITLPLSNIFSSIFDQYSIACLPETITLLLSNVFSSIFTQYSIGSPAETITLHLLNCFTKYLPNIQSHIEPMYAALRYGKKSGWPRKKRVYVSDVSNVFGIC